MVNLHYLLKTTDYFSSIVYVLLFLQKWDAPGYSDELRKECLMMYVNGMGLKAIARVKKIHHTTVIHWLKQVAQLLPNAYESQGNPEVGELDELETFVAKKKQNMDLDGSKSL
jgi:transposase